VPEPSSSRIQMRISSSSPARQRTELLRFRNAELRTQTIAQAAENRLSPSDSWHRLHNVRQGALGDPSAIRKAGSPAECHKSVIVRCSKRG
jgi:hypothetical protein